MQFSDKRSQAAVNNIKGLLEDLRLRGYSNEMILDAIGLGRRPVRLVLGPKGLSCPDDSSVSIRLNPMERTLYGFFLSHPEGICAEEIWSHYDELLELYSRQSVEDPDRQADAVDSICDDSRASFHTNISRIKRKITEALGIESALPLIIRRNRDGLYGIENIKKEMNYA